MQTIQFQTILATALLIGLAATPCSATAQQDGTDATGVASGSPAPARPPALEGAPTPPFALDDPDRIERGKNRFANNCAAYCHGFEGSGGKTPAFRGRQDLKPEEVFRTITVGRKGADVMPAWGNGFSDEKRWELVAYIMWLTRQPPR